MKDEYPKIEFKNNGDGSVTILRGGEYLTTVDEDMVPSLEGMIILPAKGGTFTVNRPVTMPDGASGFAYVGTLHRMVARLTDSSQLVRHMNLDKSDNRRANLQRCSIRDLVIDAKMRKKGIA